MSFASCGARLPAVFSCSIPMMSMKCLAAGMLGSTGSPVSGCGRSPNCTAAIVAIQSRKSLNEVGGLRFRVLHLAMLAYRPMASDAGPAFQALVDIMARLRGPQGCPWDREQTLESLRGFVLEETHEVLDAIDRGDTDALRGEIGDLIFEGVFLAQVCADAGQFTVADSLRAITTKLIRRHPHIFDPTGRPLDTPGEVHQQWEQIKAKEQSDAGERRAVLGGLPKALPSLLRAYEIGTRVAAVGFDWAKTSDVVDKIEEEVAELREAVASEGPARTEEEMGDLLFSIANLSRKLGIDPESALRKANEKFSEAIHRARGSPARAGTFRARRLAGRDGTRVAGGEGHYFRLRRATAAGTKITKITKTTRDSFAFTRPLV